MLRHPISKNVHDGGQLVEIREPFHKNMERFTNLRVILAQGPC
jgi:hypothetical protein